MGRGFVRIIAGKWRGRLLKIPPVKHLRPTPDRVRETLFNWLMPILNGAHCLDLFAGSGALGFEAASRGAASVALVDEAREAVMTLRQEAERLAADNIFIYRAKIPKGVKAGAEPFNIVFVDPPYHENLLLPTCFHLEAQGLLANPAYIYLEAPQRIQDNDLPSNWRVLKAQRAGQVSYHLAIRELES